MFNLNLISVFFDMLFLLFLFFLVCFLPKYRGPQKGTATEKSPLVEISRKLANSPETVRYCGLM